MWILLSLGVSSIGQNGKFCLQKNDAQSKEMSVFVQDLFQGRVNEELSQPNVNYFNKHLNSYISGHSAKLVSQHSGTISFKRTKCESSVRNLIHI